MIFRYKTDFMRYVSRLFSQGYFRWFGGELPVSPHYKLVSMVEKFDNRYATKATAQQRYRRRQRGLASCKLLMWYDAKNDRLIWLLLATEGYVGNAENFHNGQSPKNRIQVTGYELKMVPHRGRKPTISWSMTRSTYEYWHDEIQKSIRGKDDKNMEKILYSLRRICGFSSTRTQVYKLQRYAISEWKRSRSGDYPFDKVFVGWVGTFKKAELITIEEIKKNSLMRRKR